MKRIYAVLKEYFFVELLILIEVILFLTNYAPGTYFLGWDNLFPELNFQENIRRSFFAVWQEYRGLGFLDGMSFAANLPHYIFLYIMSFLLPDSLLRYFFIFFMHLLGGIGMYFLLGKLLKDNTSFKIVPFLGALFYLFNIATVQMFYAPYELFSVHFAFLPWLILAVSRFLENGLKRDLILFALFSFLSIPQAHVPTTFIVYLLALFSVIAFHLANERGTLKKVLIILAITFSMNAFWGLPYTYSVITNSQTTIDSKINQMSTEDIFLKNKARGDFVNVALMRGFWLDYTDLGPSGESNYIMPGWLAHTEKTSFFVLGFLFFFLSLMGAVIAIKRRDFRFYPFIFMFILSFLMLGNNIPVLKHLFDFLYNQIPLFAQAFRFVFTKFSILYAFSFTILLALSLSVIFENSKRIKHSFLILPFVFVIILLYYATPAFRGEFIYKNLRINIPVEYFDLTEYFKKQNRNGRIATLPQPSYWGWTYTNWGYRGSGFIWYGIPQPTLDGAFLPWSRENENYYWELSYAIDSFNKEYFEAVLDKYNVSWVVLDKNIISQYSEKATSFDKLQELLEASEKLSLTSSFGKINVYKTRHDTSKENFVSVFYDLPRISPDYKWNNYDPAYLEYADYIVSDSKNSDIFYPFRSLFTGRKQNDLEFKVSDKEEYFSFQTKIPQGLAGTTLFIPALFSEEILELNKDNFTGVSKYPEVFLDNEVILANIDETDDPQAKNLGISKIHLPYIREGNLEIRIPKIRGYYSYNSSDLGDLFNRSYTNCNPFAKGSKNAEKVSENTKEFLRLSSKNSSNCFDFDLPAISQRIGYLAKIESRNITGKSLLFAVINKNSKRPDLEVNLPKSKDFENSYFIIPPMENYALGYNLYFDNVSIGSVESINDLAGIEIHPIPYRYLTSLKIVREEKGKASDTHNLVVNHPDASFYKIEFKDPLKPNATLVLSQSYDPGWLAIGGVGEHVLVNNWANGWVLDDSNTKQPNNNKLVILFLPQYLQYLGFILLIIGVLYLAKLKN